MTDRRDLDEMNVLAAEYASGVLDGIDLEQARRREAADPAFAREVARWRGRLASLHDEVAPVDPPAGFWSRIERALGSGPAANDNSAALHQALTKWRAATGAMTALAACLALVLVLQQRPPLAPPPQQTPQPAPAAAPAAPPMVAMVGDKQATKVMISWDPSARQMVLAVAGTLPGDASHSHELWVIPADGTPRSLGMMPADKQSHMRLAEALASLLQQGATIAISVEPRGGSPTGAPTGPVIATGALTRA
jgi:anti-sigma-K factor RskA